MQKKSEQKGMQHITSRLNPPLQFNHFGTMPVAFELAHDEEGVVTVHAKMTLPRHYKRRVRKHISEGLALKLGDDQYRFVRQNEHDDTLIAEFSVSDSDALGHPLQLTLQGKLMATVHIAQDGSLSEDKHNAVKRHHASDLRGLSQEWTGKFPYDRDILDHYAPEKHSPLTELHTHLTGQISSDALLEIGKETYYPIELLLTLPGVTLEDIPPGAARKDIAGMEFKPMAQDGLRCEMIDPVTNRPFKDIPGVRLGDLPEKIKAQLAVAMQIPEDRVYTFGQLEREVYRYRNPIAKQADLQEALVMKVAEEYRDQGVKYAELSVTSWPRPDYLDKVIPALEKAEATYGVNMRLLLGIPREMSARDMIDSVEKIKTVGAHPRIAGVDFLGYENTRSQYMEYALRHLASFATELERDGGGLFTLRVHAGENGKNIANVRHAMQIAQETGAKIRIGHGVHIDADKLEIQKLAKELADNDQLIVELNPSSNMGLNNIDQMEDIPAREWVKLGVPISISTDGMGIYQDSSERCAIQLLHAGLELDDLEKIRNWERDLFLPQIAEEVAHRKAYLATKYPECTTDEERHSAYIKECSEKDKELLLDRKEQRLRKDIRNKTPIVIAGASGGSWNQMTPEAQLEARVGIAMLAQLLNSEKCYLGVGRLKSEGVTHYVDEALRQIDSDVALVGIMASAGRHMAVPRTISHIYPIEGDLFNVPIDMVNFLQKHKGYAFYIGGSGFTRDFILLSEDKEIPFAVMTSATGASQQKARVLSKARHFEDGVSMVKQAMKMEEILQKTNPQAHVFAEGADLSDEALQQLHDSVRSRLLEEDKVIGRIEPRSLVQGRGGV